MAPYEPIWWARTEVGYEDEKRRDQFVALPESLAKTALSWRAVLKVTTFGELRAGSTGDRTLPVLDGLIDVAPQYSFEVGQRVRTGPWPNE